MEKHGKQLQIRLCFEMSEFVIKWHIQLLGFNFFFHLLLRIDKLYIHCITRDFLKYFLKCNHACAIEKNPTSREV